MQISAANLLATQTQASLPQRGAVAAFEPIAFKQTPMTAAPQAPAKPAAPPASGTTTVAGRAASAPFGTGYVRPGTNIDIKV